MGLASKSDKLEKGRLSDIAGKAFALLSIAAISLPLIFIGQGMRIIPGDTLDRTYADIPTKIEQVIEHFNSAAEIENAVFVETAYQPIYHVRKTSQPFDTDISGVESMVAVGAAAVAGAAGLHFGSAERRQVEAHNAGIEAQIEARFEDLYEREKDQYIASLSSRGTHQDGSEKLSIDDLGRLAVMGNEDLENLPDHIKAQAYRAQRDIALAALYENGLQDKVDFHPANDVRLGDKTMAAQAEIFRLQRDAAWKAVNHHLTVEDLVARSQPREAKTAAGGLLGSLMIIDIMDGDIDFSALSGAGLGVLVLVAAAAAGTSAYLIGASVYENFFRALPDMKEFREPGTPELLSARDRLVAARQTIFDHNPGNGPAAPPVMTSPAPGG